MVIHPHRKTALWVCAVVGFMLLLSFAAVPLYKAFCQIVGYGGTTQRSSEETVKVSQITGDETSLYGNIKIRFDSNIAGNLPWEFSQEVNVMEVPIGQTAVAYYRARNLSKEETIAQATFNVTPHIAGKYFVKIDCFCFSEQILKAGEVRQMPVNFYIDSDIRQDSELQNLEEITLSYTFFSLYEAPSETSNITADEAGESSHSHDEDDGHDHSH